MEIQTAPAPAASRSRSAAILVGLVVVVTVLIWAGVHNARERRLAMQSLQAQQASRVALIPEAAGKGGAAENPDAPKMQGKVAPGFSLVDLDGKKVSLASFKGKPVLINFWATWCAPCKLEMPWFEEFHQKYASQGLVILGIAADEAGKDVIASTARKLGVTYPVLLKTDEVETAYGGVDYLPESFYVDKTGKVFLETAGMNDDAGGKDEIEANIKKLIAAGGQ
ncbi:TlpA disulfide reductase family protein [Granulicella tundricola]|uniref:TlpA disulfide reductase family protein n=1 Tax=Granulicella tundricola TaxID=940615 RepID=UPI000318E5E2|nr:TlpA disulfide reductase family protein [Granulicella tundricola]